MWAFFIFAVTQKSGEKAIIQDSLKTFYVLYGCRVFARQQIASWQPHATYCNFSQFSNSARWSWLIMTLSIMKWHYLAGGDFQIRDYWECLQKPPSPDRKPPVSPKYKSQRLLNVFLPEPFLFPLSVSVMKLPAGHGKSLCSSAVFTPCAQDRHTRRFYGITNIDND